MNFCSFASVFVLIGASMAMTEFSINQTKMNLENGCNYLAVNVQPVPDSGPLVSKLDTMDTRLEAVEWLLQQMKANGSFTSGDHTQQLKQIATQLKAVNDLLEQRLLQPADKTDDGPVKVTFPNGSYPRGTGKCPVGFGHWYRNGRQVNLHLTKPSCYKFVKTDFSWVQARKNCRKMGADLVAIETGGENEHLVWIIKRHASLQTPEIVNYRCWGYPTGGNDLASEGDWRWVYHNMKLSYKNWIRGEPNNAFGGTEHCLQLRKNREWKWNDLPCHVETVASICEIDANYE